MSTSVNSNPSTVWIPGRKAKNRMVTDWHVEGLRGLFVTFRRGTWQGRDQTYPIRTFPSNGTNPGGSGFHKSAEAVESRVCFPSLRRL